ncbi:MAG: alpha/beta fold hydrolase [Deltaproteobacteria bacterium]|nr:alpha/beta fold hydrolase [Deltaproteobacteria bacterium]MCB9789262.1 alpha/beta fold hydrolase [Deltaproteobacteria bacterium]
MEFEPEFIEVVAPGGRPRATAMLVHGILGSGANWRSFARKLVAAHPEWRVVLPDLRNHGRSRGALPPHTVAACAADLARLGRRFDVAPSVCIGHSYGGKVALAWARDHGGDHAREVWALDSPPGTGRGADESSADGVGRVLEALRRVRMPVARREDLVAALDELGLSAAVAQWMTTNLEAAPGGYRWRFDIDAIEAMVDEYLRADLWPVVEAPPVGLRVGLVIAGRGGRYDRAERLRAERARGPRVEVHELPGSGHWVHVDAPGPLAALLGDVLARSLPAD